MIWDLLKPGGRFLNHAIGRPVSFDGDPQPSKASEVNRQLQIALGMRGPSKTGSSFIDRYVFPDGELHEVGTMVSMFQTHGFEVRHLESLREHYAITLRRWVDNLTKRYDEAVEEVGVERARVWRLYMAGSAVGFERHRLEIHQVLSVRPLEGRSGMPLRSTSSQPFSRRLRLQASVRLDGASISLAVCDDEGVSTRPWQSVWHHHPGSAHRASNSPAANEPPTACAT